MYNKIKEKRVRKQRRHSRVRARVKGTKERPRLCVYRSLRYIYAQLIDDMAGETLVSAYDKEIKPSASSGSSEEKTKKTDLARETGKLLAKKASEKNIAEVIFDRGSCRYHGRVKALAEGARDGGLKF